MEANIILEQFTERVDKFDGEIIEKGIRGCCVGLLKKACKTDENYRLVMKMLTGQTSSKSLHDAQWFALYHFVLPVKKDEHDKWHSNNPDLESMCNALITRSYTMAQTADGQQAQTEMF